MMIGVPARDLSGPLGRRLTSRSALRSILGVVWLVDAALQFQPAMFGPAFARDVLEPVAQGQPAFVAAPVLHAVQLVASAPAAWNAVFASVQLLLGLGLLLRWRPRLVLGASIAWSLAVWWLGEGLGGVLGGGATPVTGAPGAALLYALLAVLAWPAREAGQAGQAGIAPPGRAARASWTAFWVSGAVLSLVPGAPTSRSLARAVDAGAAGAPGPIASLDHAAAHALAALGAPAVVALAVLEAAVALSVLGPVRLARVGLATGALLSVAFWIVGQDLGAPWSGVATDVNLAPLAILLGAAVAGSLPPVGARRGADGRARRVRGGALTVTIRDA